MTVNIDSKAVVAGALAAVATIAYVKTVRWFRNQLAE